MALEHTITLGISMLIVAMAAALLARRWRLPYTIVLVIAGLIIAWTNLLPGLRLDPDVYAAICYKLLLPILLFEAALNLKWELFSRNWREIFTLAVPGTLVCLVLVGFLAYELLGLDLMQALLLGAIIAPTDPLSVVGIFRDLGVPRRLSVLLEGESLFNDAIGLVVFTILLSALDPGTDITIVDGISTFILMSIGGGVVGGVLGLAASWLTRHVDDHLIEVTLSTVTAYGAFLAAETLQIGGYHMSGIIAVVVAGLLMGNYGKAVGMSATTVVALHTFWEYAAFVVNSIIFLLIGVELGATHLPDTPTVIAYVVLIFVLLQISRTVVSYGAGALIRRFWQELPETWCRMLVWGGLKGALSMIMVVQVPTSTRYWQGFDFLLIATFGVVFLSLMLQGLSVRYITRRWGLAARQEAMERYQQLLGRIIIHRAAVSELDRLDNEHVITTQVCRDLEDYHETQLAALTAEIQQLHVEVEALRERQQVKAQRLTHHAQKSALLEAFHRGLISEDVLNELMVQIDQEHQELEAKQDQQQRIEADRGAAEAEDESNEAP